MKGFIILLSHGLCHSDGVERTIISVPVEGLKPKFILRLRGERTNLKSIISQRGGDFPWRKKNWSLGGHLRN